MAKILIVDDEKVIRNALQKTFGKYGECISVESGNDALNEYKKADKDKQPFDLIILDISLEDKSGLDVLKEIRSQEKEKKVKKDERIRIIMATGNREKKIVKECIASGCNDYILKPIKPDMITEKLSTFGLKPLDSEEESKKEKKKDKK